MPLTATRQPGANTASDLENRMRMAIREIGIPPRPTILARIDAEMARDEPDFILLGRTISADVALSAALLKTANSPAFGLGKPVRSIQEALLLLGLRLTARTIAGLALQQTFQHVPNMERFWVATSTVAQVAAWLARTLALNPPVRPEDAYTFALFRDCGIPMLCQPFPEYRAALARASEAETQSFTDIEEAAIALNHALIGAELAEDWRLPTEVCLAIRHHHAQAAIAGDSHPPLPRHARQLIALAQLAEVLVQQQTGLLRNCEWHKLGSVCLAQLDLGDDAVADLQIRCAQVLTAR